MELSEILNWTPASELTACNCDLGDVGDAGEPAHRMDCSYEKHKNARFELALCFRRVLAAFGVLSNYEDIPRDLKPPVYASPEARELAEACNEISAHLRKGESIEQIQASLVELARGLHQNLRLENARSTSTAHCLCGGTLEVVAPDEALAARLMTSFDTAHADCRLAQIGLQTRAAERSAARLASTTDLMTSLGELCREGKISHWSLVVDGNEVTAGATISGTNDRVVRSAKDELGTLRALYEEICVAIAAKTA